MAFSPYGKTLATASLDYSIRLWDFEKRERIATLQGHLSEVWSLAFSPDGRSLITGAKDGSIKIWSTTRRRAVDVFARASTPLAFSKDGRTLAALQQQNSIALLDLGTGEIEQQFHLESSRGFRGGPRPRPGQSVSISGDLRKIAQGLEDGSVKIWDIETHDTNIIKVSTRPVDLTVLSPDGRYLIAGSHDQALQWWDLRTASSSALDTEAQRVQFSPDAKTLAVFGRDNKLEFWDAATHTMRTNLVLEIQPGMGAQAAFSPDSRLLAVVCQDDSVHLVDIASSQTVAVFTGHKQPLTSVAFSPDGRTLATASEDSTMKLWNVASGQELLSVRRLGSAMFGLLFSPDGSLLVGGTSPFAQTSGIRFYRAAQLQESETISASAAR
jgi:WD40 repeat protein